MTAIISESAFFIIIFLFSSNVINGRNRETDEANPITM
jgi:hypothetical protein